MPYAAAKDGTRLYFEQCGKGTPLIFVHEFSGDYRSWEAQMRFFSRRYRCIAFNARGYPPSDVPTARTKYGYKISIDDVADVQRHLKFKKSHIVGCSMGAYTALSFGIYHAARAISVTTVGAGAGSDLSKRKEYLKSIEVSAQNFEKLGMPVAVQGRISVGRISQMVKDPRGFAEFRRFEAEHAAIGLAHTQRNVQGKRPPIYHLENALRRYRPPLLVISGDEDGNSIPPALFIKKVCANARLWICPSTGHTVNTEEPDQFNRVVLDFLTLVDSGSWRPRDPRSLVKSG